MSFYLPKGAERPPRIARGLGVHLYDENGDRYLDATSGAVVSNLGHSNPRVVAAMCEQAHRVTFAYPRFFESEHNVRLAGKLSELCGPGFDRAFFVSGGSEANESALKLARQYAIASGQPTRWKVISRDPSYHGATMGALAVTGDSFTESIYRPMFQAMPKIPAPLTYRLPVGVSAEEHVRACADALERCILDEGPETVLAFILEPVGGLSTGALVSPPAYYRQIREICDRYGVLLIHDEIMSGAGRTGAFLSSQHWDGSRPDIVTMAKGLAAGYTPFGAVLAPNWIVETIAAQGGFVHGHTYFSNPFSCAVAVAVIDEVVDQGLIERARRMGPYLEQRLRDLQQASRLIGDVRGKGLLMAIELVADKETQQQLPPAMNAPGRLTSYGLAHGVALYNRRANRGQFGDIQLIAPPLIITESEVDDMIDRLGRALSEFERDLAREGAIRG
ncbi:aminotransferase family protein [Burkholderia ubonensis]|uniref:aminotransferase family protein n=1 Tax=Burkholderia ubonensis TaxID=101571 RepID=UPI00075CA090|nr:aspartate aminotransferase family protein [Burkholderia ubonensis]KVG23666.1 aminotransferase [Burkholderia ubonensis]OJA67025.1 aminotransferase [Burkholderia ubonensis]